MTPAQQAALETLAGRSMTPGEIALAAIRNDAGLAASLSVDRKMPASRLIGIGTIQATLGAGAGAFLDGLVTLGQTDRDVFWAMELIKSGTLDIGMPETRTQIETLAAANSGIAQPCAAILALAVVDAPLPTDQVSAILNGA